MNNLETFDNVRHIFPVNKQNNFSQDEAKQLVNLLHIVTQKSKNNINAYSGQLNYHKNSPKDAKFYQDKLNAEIQKWSEKVRRLGAVPLSLYKVKIKASDETYYTWEFPGIELIHYN
tara:strand:+ start:32147 stop:32497 length:351 start_codon:yes stop_codon:yes gene_type:complete